MTTELRNMEVFGDFDKNSVSEWIKGKLNAVDLREKKNIDHSFKMFFHTLNFLLTESLYHLHQSAHFNILSYFTFNDT